MNVVTRFAPSPTGKLHIGAYRTAIFAYLYAKKHGGKFILRIEDTDKERSTKENEENILESLQWLGLNYDEKYIQSENVERHKEVLLDLINSSHAYISKEEAKDGSGIIKQIVRFKNPNINVTFKDEIKGEVTMDTTDLGDFVIAKNIDEPLFHLAVVVDDFDEGVTHVIRGEDHVSNTPRQILIQRAINAPTPVYAHLPLVLGEDKQKLSKRKGALAVTEYQDLGYLPEAILNMASMLGWNPGNDQEFFSKNELIKEFDLAKIQKSPAVFNIEKLNWYNKEYIKKLSDEDFLKNIDKYLPSYAKENLDILNKILYLVREHIFIFSNVVNLFNEEKGEMDFFFVKPKFDEKMLISPKTKITSSPAETIQEYLKNIKEIVNGIQEWTIENIKESIMSYADEKGRGDVLWALRVKLTGQEKSPDPFTVIYILGKERVLAWLE